MPHTERESRSTFRNQGDHMEEAFKKAFEEWERRYREAPETFMSDVARFTTHTPTTLAELQAAYFLGLLNELSAGQPWNTIK